ILLGGASRSHPPFPRSARLLRDSPPLLERVLPSAMPIFAAPPLLERVLPGALPIFAAGFRTSTHSAWIRGATRWLLGRASCSLRWARAGCLLPESFGREEQEAWSSPFRTVTTRSRRF